MKALVVVDWQREWINPESEYYIGSDLQEYTSRINQVIKFARNNNLKIIFVRHCEKEGNAFAADSDSAKIIGGIDISCNSDILVQKYKIYTS